MNSAAWSMSSLEGAPVPGALKAGCQATDTIHIWTLSRCRGVDLDCSGTAGAFTVGAARAHLLPFTELRVASIARPLEVSIRMEESMFVQLHFLLRVLPAKDMPTLSAMVLASEDSKWSLAGRCCTD